MVSVKIQESKSGDYVQLWITIPKVIAMLKGFHKGDKLNIEEDKDGNLLLRKNKN